MPTPPKSSPLPWQRDGRFLFSLQETKGSSGYPAHENRFWASFQGGPNCSEAELEANAELALTAVNSHAALVAALETITEIATRRWKPLPPDSHEKKSLNVARELLASLKKEIK